MFLCIEPIVLTSMFIPQFCN